MDSCSTFIGQVSLPCIRQLLTQIVYSSPFSFNKNPFQLEWISIYQTFSKQIWLWLLLPNHIIHLHPTHLLNNIIYLPFPVIPHYQYPEANQYVLSPSVIGLSTLQLLHCTDFLSLHYIHHVWIHFLQLQYKIKLLLITFLHTLQGHLPLYSTLSFILQLNITFVFPAFIFKPLSSLCMTHVPLVSFPFENW